MLFRSRPAAPNPGVTTSATPSAITAHPARLTGIAAMVGADSAWSASAPLTAVAAPTTRTQLPAGAAVGVAGLTACPAHTPGPTGRALTVVGAEDAGGPLAAGAALPAGAAITSGARDGLTARPAAPNPGVTTNTTRTAGAADTAGHPGIAAMVGAVRASSTGTPDTAVAALTAHTLLPAGASVGVAGIPAGPAHTPGPTGRTLTIKHPGHTRAAAAAGTTRTPGTAGPGGT